MYFFRAFLILTQLIRIAKYQNIQLPQCGDVRNRDAISTGPASIEQSLFRKLIGGPFLLKPAKVNEDIEQPGKTLRVLMEFAGAEPGFRIRACRV